MPDCMACPPSRKRSFRPLLGSNVTAHGSLWLVRMDCSATTRPLTLVMVASASMAHWLAAAGVGSRGSKRGSKRAAAAAAAAAVEGGRYARTANDPQVHRTSAMEARWAAQRPVVARKHLKRSGGAPGGACKRNTAIWMALGVIEHAGDATEQEGQPPANPPPPPPARCAAPSRAPLLYPRRCTKPSA